MLLIWSTPGGDKQYWIILEYNNIGGGLKIYRELSKEIYREAKIKCIAKSK